MNTSNFLELNKDKQIVYDPICLMSKCVLNDFELKGTRSRKGREECKAWGILS